MLQGSAEFGRGEGDTIMTESTAIAGQDFSGKTVIVTGAGSGIGKATALLFAARGARVIATDVVQARLDALAAETGGAITILAGDVSSEDTAQALVKAAGERIDVLANVAGIMDSFEPAGEVVDAVWDKVMAVNVTGPMRLMRAVLPAMLAAGKGAIVNVSSEAGLRGSCAGAAYTSSKHALNGLTKNAAFMYGAKGIRVNAIAPGAVITGIEANMVSPLAQQRLGPLMQVIVPPPAKAEQLAEGIVWLASDAASNINGVILPSDGGWSAA